MQSWEEKIMERVKGKAEALFIVLEKYGVVPEELQCRIMEQYDSEILNSWLKTAVNVNSIEEFAEKISQ